MPKKDDKSVKVPRASIAVTLLEDADFIRLMKSKDGKAAIADWLALLLVAKMKKNGGEFDEDLMIISSLARSTDEDIQNSIADIAGACKDNGNEAWIVEDGGKITIRNFKKWNDNRGGSRTGSGRKSNQNGDED